MKRFLTAAISSIGLLAGLAHAAPTYMPVGPQTNVATSTVTNGGWTLCYSGAFATPIGINAQNVLKSCQGTYLMMAAGATDSFTLMTLAAGLRSDVITDTGAGTSNTHIVNGSKWYFAPDWSWGFTEPTDAVNLNSCDYQNSSPMSICLHTLDNIGGYRINDIVDLNESTAYTKYFYVADDLNPLPVPGSLALLGLGLLGFGAIRRKQSD